MTIQRQWAHSFVYADSRGIASAQLLVSGDFAVSGGGYAECVTNTSVASTTEDLANASGLLPIVAIRTYLYSGDTYSEVTFSAPPNAIIRAHVFATWDDGA
jgi:hypothetical protein